MQVRIMSWLMVFLIFFAGGFVQSAPLKQVRVTLRIEKSLTIAGQEFDLLYTDRYFYIDNRGLTSVRAELNGFKFRLTVDTQEVDKGMNIYLIPLHGHVVIDIHPLLKQDSNNHMRIDGQGPAGADAEILIGDQPVGGTVDFVLNASQLPRLITLQQNFPNPFNLATTIGYEVPDYLDYGAHVELVIYNLRGQTVRTLVAETRFPGAAWVQWNSLNDRGEQVASGAYFYRLRVGTYVATRKLILAK
jgi:hypothetical protein